jgi:hypothetical protein
VECQETAARGKGLAAGETQISTKEQFRNRYLDGNDIKMALSEIGFGDVKLLERGTVSCSSVAAVNFPVRQKYRITRILLYSESIDYSGETLQLRIYC